jgi:hypothetical protein
MNDEGSKRGFSLFGQATSIANTVIIWISLFSLIAAGLTWFAESLTVFGELNRADAVLIGLVLTCILAATLAAMLSAWRYFRRDAGASEEKKKLIAAAREIVANYEFGGHGQSFGQYLERQQAYMAIRRYLSDDFVRTIPGNGRTLHLTAVEGDLHPVARQYLREVERLAESWGVN